MTAITKVPNASGSLFAEIWSHLVSIITTLYYVWDYFSSSSVVSCAFSALCLYLKFWHHPHPLGYLGVKFCFFRGLHYWKKCVLNHSLTQLIWCPWNRSDSWLQFISRCELMTPATPDIPAIVSSDWDQCKWLQCCSDIGDMHAGVSAEICHTTNSCHSFNTLYVRHRKYSVQNNTTDRYDSNK